MKQNEFYAIVVGGGPAGASFANKITSVCAAKIAIVDRHFFPRDKACGDGLGPGVIGCLHDLGLENIVAGHKPIEFVSVSSPSGYRAEGHLPRISSQPAVGYVIRRREFDNMLFTNAVKRGAFDYSGHDFQSATYDSTAKWWRVVLKTRMNEHIHIKSRVLIGADGATSRVRRLLGEPMNPAEFTAIASRAYVDFSQHPPAALQLDFRRNLLPAYGWVFPMEGGWANVGVGIEVEKLKKHSLHLKNIDAHYKASIAKEYGLSIDSSNYLTAPLPCGIFMPEIGHPDVRAALIGDAASMINPLTGEGIYYGMYAGILLAEMFEKSYLGSLTEENAISGYAAHFYEKFRQHYRTNWQIRKRLSNPRWCDLAVSAFSHNSTIMDEFVEVMMGDRKKLGRLMPLKIGFWGMFG